MWGTEEAEVACQQLGYAGAGKQQHCTVEITTVLYNYLCYIFFSATPFSGAFFGQGDGPIVADRAVCTGDEGRLSDCMYNLNHRCTHANDAGVRCTATNDGQ